MQLLSGCSVLNDFLFKIKKSKCSSAAEQQQKRCYECYEPIDMKLALFSPSVLHSSSHCSCENLSPKTVEHFLWLTSRSRERRATSCEYQRLYSKLFFCIMIKIFQQKNIWLIELNSLSKIFLINYSNLSEE